MTRNFLTALFLTVAVPGLAGAADEKEDAGAAIERGKYLVATSGCNDCHTPWIMGDAGPEPDMTRMLSGHPQDIPITVQASLTSPWAAATSETNTAISGPWGISFAANLTPHPEYGVLRDYTAEDFLAAMRTGRHKGVGREILPPMPWSVYGQMIDEDLRAIYAYLRQIPAVENKVQMPVAPMAPVN